MAVRGIRGEGAEGAGDGRGETFTSSEGEARAMLMSVCHADCLSAGRLRGAQPASAGLHAGGRSVRGLHNDTGSGLVGGAGGGTSRQLRWLDGTALWVPGRGVIGDEWCVFATADDTEVGLAQCDKGGHAGQGVTGDPEGAGAVEERLGLVVARGPSVEALG